MSIKGSLMKAGAKWAMHHPVKAAKLAAHYLEHKAAQKQAGKSSGQGLSALFNQDTFQAAASILPRLLGQ